MIFSGEFHAYRLPVPGLWLDVFQKVKALGFSAISFYVDWALLEGKPGNYSAEGVLCTRAFLRGCSRGRTVSHCSTGTCKFTIRV